MTPAATSAQIACVSAPLPAVDADLLIVPWFEDDAPSAVPGLDAATGGDLTRALESKEFTARPYELFVTPIVDRAWSVRRVVLVGAGRAAGFGGDLARKLAAASGLSMKQRRIARAAFLVRAGGPGPGGPGAPGANNAAELAQAVAEGLTLSEFNVGSYKTSDAPPGNAPAWTVVIGSGPDGNASAVAEAVRRGRLLGECSNMARELSNEPGNTLTPREFARRSEGIASGNGLSVEVLDEKAIEHLGMGLLLGVARGSHEPPRLMVFRHDPPGAPAGPVLGLVGKGVTFDTGGISIKPADGMERMKDDMAGGAAVVCAMRAIGALNAPIRVVGVVPTAENMPGSRAIKPGDILKSAAGKTVEVVNTDAEGRLILGDGLWYARQLGATHLVDVATLTGAIVVALGKITSGLFGTPPAWVDLVRRVADRAGDRVWPMPTFEEYGEQIKSEIADLVNSSGRPAGSVTAALFLKEFTGGLPWAHLDIAGTAWLEEAKPYLPKGPSGVAVRMLAELAFTSREWP
jgi:leucyl aminopeptidase